MTKDKKIEMQEKIIHRLEEEKKSLLEQNNELTFDDTYNKIYDGTWRCDCPYGVIHRIAGNGSIKGVLPLSWFPC